MNKLQKDYEERLAKQRKNRSNWSGLNLGSSVPKDIQEANDVLYEGRYYKPTKKWGKKL